MFFFSKLNITQRALCSPGIKKSYMKECLLTRYWSALDKNSRQWSYKPIPPVAHAASHKIIMWALTMRISTLTPWKVVGNFCGSKSVPSVEGEWKLSQSPQTILGQSNFVPYECSSGCVSHWSLQPVFFLFRRPFSYSPHFWGLSARNWYLLCGSTFPTDAPSVRTSRSHDIYMSQWSCFSPKSLSGSMTSVGNSNTSLLLSLMVTK